MSGVTGLGFLSYDRDHFPENIVVPGALNNYLDYFMTICQFGFFLHYICLIYFYSRSTLREVFVAFEVISDDEMVNSEEPKQTNEDIWNCFLLVFIFCFSVFFQFIDLNPLMDVLVTCLNPIFVVIYPG
jgi:hypothetical protein